MKDIKTIVIQLDFMQGPIWISDAETGEPLTGIKIIDTDIKIRELNYKIQNMYNAYYEFNSHGEPCKFNFEKEKSERNELLILIKKLILRLNELCDGSYVVEDRESGRKLAE